MLKMRFLMCFFILSTVTISHNNSKSNNSLFGELIATSGTSYPDLSAKINSSVLELFCLLRAPFFIIFAQKGCSFEQPFSFCFICYTNFLFRYRLGFIFILQPSELKHHIKVPGCFCPELFFISLQAFFFLCL